MQKQKSTLVIHPSDPSTDCLKVIYENRDWTVIRDFDESPEYIAGQIGKYDRIVLLGHGTAEGLMPCSMRRKWRRIWSFSVELSPST